jgi:hypothetical protein
MAKSATRQYLRHPILMVREHQVSDQEKFEILRSHSSLKQVFGGCYK